MNHNDNSTPVSVIQAVAALLLASTVAMAAMPALAASAADDPSEGSVLQEVVVSARKRDEKLLDVPAPVSTISADTLEQTQSVRLEDYLTRLPGVTFDDQRAGQTRITFRGINAGDSNATVVTYIDNVPMTPSASNANSAYVTPSLDPSDLAQIEVVRGPQGTLYGANAIGGVLKYVTIKPDPNHFSGRVEVTGDTAHDGGLGGALRGAVNIPLVADTLGLRLSAFTRKDPGYIDDPSLGLTDVNSTRTHGFRAALLWNATDNITVNLSALIQVMKSQGNDSVDIDPYTNESLYGGLTHERSWRNEFFKARYGVYNADIQWNLGWANLMSSTSFSTLTNGADNDVSPAYSALLEGALGVANVGLDNPLQVYGRQSTEELRLTSSTTGPLEWQLGFYYTHDQTTYAQSANMFDIATQTYVTQFGPTFDGYHNNDYLERSGFGNIDYHFTNRFDVNVGARYSVDDQQLESFFEGLIFGPTVHVKGLEHEHASTWAVNPRFKLTDDQMVYARVATGYRPGGVSFLTPDAVAAGIPSTFKPDHLTSYEAGWKAAVLERRATVDLSVYYIRWKDVQESVTLGAFTFGANAGRAHSEGVEASFTWVPINRLKLAASATYNDNRLDDDAQSNVDLAQTGHRLPLTPRFSGQFDADYNFPLATNLDGFAGLSVFATMARPNSLSLGYDPQKASGEGAINNFGVIPIYDPNTGAITGYTRNLLPGYATLDLRAGVIRGPWTIQAFVKNVTDTRAFVGYGGLNNPSFGNFSNQWTATVLPPRTIGLTASMKF